MRFLFALFAAPQGGRFLNEQRASKRALLTKTVSLNSALFLTKTIIMNPALFKMSAFSKAPRQRGTVVSLRKESPE